MPATELKVEAESETETDTEVEQRRLIQSQTEEEKAVEALNSLMRQSKAKKRHRQEGYHSNRKSLDGLELAQRLSELGLTIDIYTTEYNLLLAAGYKQVPLIQAAIFRRTVNTLLHVQDKLLALEFSHDELLSLAKYKHSRNALEAMFAYAPGLIANGFERSQIITILKHHESGYELEMVCQNIKQLRDYQFTNEEILIFANKHKGSYILEDLLANYTKWEAAGLSHADIIQKYKEFQAPLYKSRTGLFHKKTIRDRAIPRSLIQTNTAFEAETDDLSPLQLAESFAPILSKSSYQFSTFEIYFICQQAEAASFLKTIADNLELLQSCQFSKEEIISYAFIPKGLDTLKLLLREYKRWETENAPHVEIVNKILFFVGNQGELWEGINNAQSIAQINSLFAKGFDVKHIVLLMRSDAFNAIASILLQFPDAFPAELNQDLFLFILSAIQKYQQKLLDPIFAFNLSDLILIAAHKDRDLLFNLLFDNLEKWQAVKLSKGEIIKSAIETQGPFSLMLAYANKQLEQVEEQSSRLGKKSKLHEEEANKSPLLSKPKPLALSQMLWTRPKENKTSIEEAQPLSPKS